MTTTDPSSVYLVLLRLSTNQTRAAVHLDAHRQWIQQGFADGVFLLAGTLEPAAGGAIWAHKTTLAELQQRLAQDPFVSESIVSPEILQITPARAAEALAAVLR